MRLTSFATLIGLTLAVTACSSPSDGNSVEGHSSESDSAWLGQHGRDPAALDAKFGTDAQTACSIGVDDYLRQVAAHDFAWDEDAKGFFGIKFDKRTATSEALGVLTLMTTRAKLQNGFGAFDHIDVYCSYDVSTKRVLRYSMTDPTIGKSASASDDNDLSNPAENVAINSANNDAAEPVGNTADAAPQILSKDDPSLPIIVRNAARLDEDCRGGTDDVDNVCRVRDEAFRRAEQAGWCYGDENTPDSEASWHRCVPPTF